MALVVTRRLSAVRWTVPREWNGQTAFVIAGGPSVAGQDVEALRGRRVIVVNSSYQRAPWADVLFFGDTRWWTVHRPHLRSFPGRIVTVATSCSGVLRLSRLDTRHGLSHQPDMVVMGRTSLQGAINLAYLFGSRRIVLLGADMQAAPDGLTHHHEPHPWPQRPGCWDEHMDHLRQTAVALRAAGAEVINTSPVSRIDWWPIRTLEEVL